MPPNYLWFSNASDVTGKKLAERLGFLAGSKSPNFNEYGVVLGWGCKPGSKYSAATAKKKIEQGELRLLNPVERVQGARDKLSVLKALRASGISVPEFVCREPGQNFATAIQQGLVGADLDIPLIGLDRNHKNTPVFIHTLEDVAKVAEDPMIEYVRNIVPGTEYRLHVVLGKVVLVQEKVPTDQPKDDIRASRLRSLQKGMARAKLPLVAPEVADWLSEWAAVQVANGPSRILRSLGNGWKLADVEPDLVNANLKAAARCAMDILGLDAGAVSIEVSGKAFWVTGVATAPVLEEKHIEIYAREIQKFVEVGGAPVEKKPAAKVAVPAEVAAETLVARIRKKLRGADKAKLAEVEKLLG